MEVMHSLWGWLLGAHSSPYSSDVYANYLQLSVYYRFLKAKQKTPILFQ